MPTRYSYGKRDPRVAREEPTWRAGVSFISVDLPQPADPAANGADRAMPLVEVQQTVQHRGLRVLRRTPARDLPSH